MNRPDEAERIKGKQTYTMHYMRRVFFIFTMLAVTAACGCVAGTDYGTPTPAPVPTAEPLPTAEPVPTAEPLPTLQPEPTDMPVPPSSSDPIIGTWLWQGANNTVTIYAFNDDGTFQRRDEDRNMTVYTGVWERQGQDTYTLIYNTPVAGIAKETVTYYPGMSRLESNQTFYARV
jgi:hypothetical protein